jgi:ABC-type multidrug transport system ATPase subunit
MILTTHLMEEAEVLTDRIGIIVQGQLKCMGTQFKLKRIYGRGFKLVINLNNESIFEDESDLNQEEKMNEIIKFIKDVFSKSLVKDKFKNTIVFQVNLYNKDPKRRIRCRKAI